MFMITGHTKTAPPTALVLFPSYSTAANYLWQWGVKKETGDLFEVVEAGNRKMSLAEAFSREEFRLGFDSTREGIPVLFESITIEPVDFGRPIS